MSWLMLFPAACMLAAALAPRRTSWTGLHALCGLALACTLLNLGVRPPASAAWLSMTVPAAVLAVLVQGLGLVVTAFSARYLQGEVRQAHYRQALALVLGSVQVLLLANHWLVLIGTWIVAGMALERLLCFYPERPFARLAALKKRVADRAADVLLLAAAALAWSATGSGLLSGLAQPDGAPLSVPLQASAVCLVLAVLLRTAALPAHGWLIQVMEAPTPVSALLHAGVVNLGAVVLLRCAPLLDQAPLARGLLVAGGLATAALAGLVLLTRISIKVRLAWSTVAQMGFLLLECGLGLYTLALLHLIGHALYKAGAFLAASSTVRLTQRSALRMDTAPHPLSLLLAPAAALAIAVIVPRVLGLDSLPPWWLGALGVLWAPLLWSPRGGAVLHLTGATATLALLGAAATWAHGLPWGLLDRPDVRLGACAVAGLAALYVTLAWLQWRPHSLEALRRASYAGFYLDERLTRLALRLHAPPAGAAT